MVYRTPYRLHFGWLRERGIEEPVDVTRPVLERYQRHLFHYRKSNGEPMSFRTQHARLVPLRVWFRWMTRQNHILHNPASELELPRRRGSNRLVQRSGVSPAVPPSQRVCSI